MRLLYVHASRFSYRTVKEAIESPPDPPASGDHENCLVAFVSVEEGDDLGVARRAVGDMVSHAERLGAREIVIYPYAHLSSELAKPKEAHRVLTAMEEAARASWRGSVYRAPFGWYKAFELSCLGHPLSELSRQFGREGLVIFQGLPLEEAIAKGLVEDWLLVKDPWDAEVKDVASRLGAEGERIMMLELENMLAMATGAKGSRSIEAPKALYGIWGAAGLLEACAKAEEGINGWGAAGDSLIVTQAEPSQLLSPLSPGLLEDAKEVAVSTGAGDGRALVYRSRRGGAPIAVEIGKKRCVGPVRSILLSMIDRALREAEKGVTPSLPPQIMPIQVALLPVSEKHLAFVEGIRRSLRELGVRVKIFSSGGLGSRIRETGRLWVPLVGTVGDREVETNTVSVRRRSEPGKQEVLKVEEFLEEAKRLRGSLLV
ncbi:MAG: His/Gly/Thr/Pro-type tRNA ligase C-terminal domain-containing protein [Acidilobaceae archaeon]|nr:His/Gly/Thr/Pro-type tRNA ligase C-terminal domain-containing protein [Acidilobaceae archaeon]